MDSDDRLSDNAEVAAELERLFTAFDAGRDPAPPLSDEELAAEIHTQAGRGPEAGIEPAEQ